MLLEITDVETLAASAVANISSSILVITVSVTLLVTLSVVPSPSV